MYIAIMIIYNNNDDYYVIIIIILYYCIQNKTETKTSYFAYTRLDSHNN